MHDGRQIIANLDYLLLKICGQLLKRQKKLYWTSYFMKGVTVIFAVSYARTFVFHHITGYLEITHSEAGTLFSEF